MTAREFPVPGCPCTLCQSLRTPQENPTMSKLFPLPGDAEEQARKDGRAYALAYPAGDGEFDERYTPFGELQDAWADGYAGGRAAHEQALNDAYDLGCEAAADGETEGANPFLRPGALDEAMSWRDGFRAYHA